MQARKGTPVITRRADRSPFGRAFGQALKWRAEAIREAIDASLPTDSARTQIMIRDPSGSLHRATVAARQAKALARTNEELCRALLLLARLECNLGRHTEELRDTEELVARKPMDRGGLYLLRHAARCNGLKPLEQKTSITLKRLPRSSNEPLTDRFAIPGGEPVGHDYVVGDVTDPAAPGNGWRTSATWPLPARPLVLYYPLDGALDTQPPADSSTCKYDYSPANPVPTRGSDDDGLEDQQSVEFRPDVLVFSVPILSDAFCHSLARAPAAGCF